jgi:hypothetical protein
VFRDLGGKPPDAFAPGGATIKVAPRATSCWEPDVICATCLAPSDTLALGMLIVAAVSGLLCFFLAWGTVRGVQNKVA